MASSDSAEQRADDQTVIMKRNNLFSKLNTKHRRLRRKFNKGLSRYTQSLDEELAYTERQNSVQTRELFKYAETREKLAICLGVLFMFYAASWQPISVFILATMASLMGQYAKQTSWLNQMLVIDQQQQQGSTPAPAAADKQANLSDHGDIESLVVQQQRQHSNRSGMLAFLEPQQQQQSDGQVVQQQHPVHLGSYSEQLDLLSPLHSLLGPIFDLGSSITSSYSSSHHSFAAPDHKLPIDAGSGGGGDDEVKLVVEDILKHESHQFLRRSFEINGSAFLLGLSQLTAFFLGISLITWVAKRQASRLKILYFRSCLHQEVTWYESIDSASGSGSSLNALVDKYEDGIGPKLALLCYFLGHVTLFACTAFYQMLSLASFCTCFVISVGLVIIYLSGGQAVAIGEHALFAKRSLQLAEEILASIRTVFAFNGQQKELTRHQVSLEPVYRKSLIKHLYTALNTSLSKFSIFACFSCYCFYARHLFPPYTDGFGLNKSTVLAVMRGGEVSIVNILISIPFMEALQQSKGSIARIYAAIERRSKINPSSERGAWPASNNWQPSISFRMVRFGYADRAGPTQRRRSTLPQLDCTRPSADLPLSSQPLSSCTNAATNTSTVVAEQRRTSLGTSRGPASAASLAAVHATRGKQPTATAIHLQQQQQSAGRRRRSIINELADEFANDVDQPKPSIQFITKNPENLKLANAHKNTTTTVGRNQQTCTKQQQTCGDGARRKSFGLDHHHNSTTTTTTSTPTSTSMNRRGSRSTRINNNNNNNGLANLASSGTAGGANNTVPTKTTVSAMAADVDRVPTSQQDKRILNRFNLEIKAGQSVALVGPSGSGKSTVLSLLLRLYDITGGQLLIGQHNIKDLNVRWLRNQIGVVTQEPRLFDMSIADNIRLGLPDANAAQGQRQPRKVQQRQTSGTGGAGDGGSDGYGDELMTENDDGSGGSVMSRESNDHVMQQVIEASKAAGAHDFIVKLPQGYRTRVGSAGVQLSGGQKQRIAIARALIRKPKILLLDESTSALDTESETQVLEALQKASAGRTTVTVAHRLKTIRHVDLIVVMSQGQVIECGTHEELMSLEAGTYKKMYQDQIEANKRQPVRGGKISALGRSGHGGVDNDNSELAPLKSNKGGLLDQIEFVTPGVADDNRRSADKTSQDEDQWQQRRRQDLLRLDEHDDNDGSPRSDGSSSSSSGSGSSYYNGDNDDYSADGDDVDDDSDDEDCDDDDQSTSDSSTNSRTDAKPNFWTLWHFVEPPKWTSVATIVVCLLAGLVLPMNLIAHSYLFSAFAYNELDQIGDYLYFFGLIMLSFSTFVFIVTFLQVILPGYVGEKISIRLRARTMDSFLHKPMFYFDMDANSAGSLCERLNSYVSNIQSIAGTRIATILEAVSTLLAGAFFGFGQNLILSTFCLSFALLVLVTTVIESRIVQRESSIQQKYDAQLAHLMADSLSNIKTIASLNKEAFFIDKFSEIIHIREKGTGRYMNWLRTFLTSLKFVMPALSWSSSMYFGSYLLTLDRIDLQTIFIVCPVVLFAVNDTFRALVFLPELLKARKSIERLYRMNREFSPEVLQTLSLAQQLEQQNRLHLEQMAAATTNVFSGSSVSFNQEATTTTSNSAAKANKALGNIIITAANKTTSDTTSAGAAPMQQLSLAIQSNLFGGGEFAHPRQGGDITKTRTQPQRQQQQHQIAIRTTDTDTNITNVSTVFAADSGDSAMTYSHGRAVATAEVGAATPVNNKAKKKSISFVEPACMNETADKTNNNNGSSTKSDNNKLLGLVAAHSQNEPQTLDLGDRTQAQIINRRMSNLAILPTYMRRKSSRLNSLVPRYQSRGRIEFRDVDFAYPNRPSALVLDGFSLNVAPGGSVALVGGSGCGKSTCVSILEKFYDYHGGKVTVDGHDLRLVDPNWVRSQIGLVSQEPTLLSYTIGDNIRYGDNSRFVSMDEVVEAARTANIHDFIMSLPDQYETELSTSAYSSSQLSGGQRQRIAIARALVRNAPILIFDEATSALDPSNEAIVQDALNKARKGRTSLTIAHRLSTIKDADKIVVLNEGKVVEIGKHDELIRRPNGHYRNLWEKHEG